MRTTSELVEGRNCWRVRPAARAAFLVDAAAFFAAFVEAAERAEHSIYVAGWDFDTRTRLCGADGDRNAPDLGRFLDDLVARRPALRIHVLEWDWPMLYVFEREPFPNVATGARPGIELRLDGAHPIGGSRHQKLVVVDDAIAFVGGLDLCVRRWDTPRHDPTDPGRVDPSDVAYRPFHDVQMLVDGEAAAAVGALFRRRWQMVTGAHLTPPFPKDARTDVWPPGTGPDLTDVDVGIARTEPAFDLQPEVREVERLHLDAIAAAARTIYLEAQYLSAACLAEALAARLAEPDGPEVVIVSGLHSPGWLEESTMDVLRARLLRRLRAADAHGRLRVSHPRVPGLPDEMSLIVHAKVLICDDAFVRVGSANASNRSMGLDAECDLAVAARGDERIEAGIAAFRHRLLGEHLDVDPDEVARAERALGSTVAAIDALAGRPRTLVPLDGEVEPWLDQLVPEQAVFDPERPVAADGLGELLGVGTKTLALRGVRRAAIGTAAAIGGVLRVGVAWLLHATQSVLKPSHAADS